MLGRSVLQRTFAAVLMAVSPTLIGLGAAGVAAAQPPAGSVFASAGSTRSAPARATHASDEIAMPDDLGAPLPGAPDPPAGSSAPQETGRSERLSVNTPIAVIASSPQGKAVLERDLPGLCERPEYMMFKTMSPAKLALLSNGRISRLTLIELQEHLVRVSVTTGAPHHNLLAEGGTRVKRFSRSVYRKVLSAIESL